MKITNGRYKKKKKIYSQNACKIQPHEKCSYGNVLMQNGEIQLTLKNTYN